MTYLIQFLPWLIGFVGTLKAVSFFIQQITLTRIQLYIGINIRRELVKTTLIGSIDHFIGEQRDGLLHRLTKKSNSLKKGSSKD